MLVIATEVSNETFKISSILVDGNYIMPSIRYVEDDEFIADSVPYQYDMYKYAKGCLYDENRIIELDEQFSKFKYDLVEVFEEAIKLDLYQEDKKFVIIK